MSQSYITCQQLIDFIAEYLSGELAPPARQDFERHLAVCGPCINYLRSYRETIRLGKAAFAEPGAPVPADVPEDLIRAILAVTKKNA